MLCTIDPPQTKGHRQSDNKVFKKVFYENGNQKKAGILILISDKIDTEINDVKWDKGWHCILIKGSIQEQYITIIHIYAPNIEAPQYVRQMLISRKGGINSNT